MNTPAHSLSIRAAEPAVGLDLDARIREAELAVIERDQRFKRRSQEVGERVHELTERLGGVARHGLGIGSAAAAAAYMFARLLPRFRSRALLGRAAAPLRTGSRYAALPWGRMLPLLWPLLPVGVRGRVNPRLAALVIGLTLPLFASGIRRQGVVPAPHVDLRRYAGRWFEIARMPLRQESHCAANASATYRLAGDEIVVTNRCRRIDGREDVVEGCAREVADGNGARLKVSFAPRMLHWLPFVWADYWILDVDPHYRTALVGTPDRKHLWVLARSPRMGTAEFDRLVGHALAQGYDTSRLRVTPQLR